MPNEEDDLILETDASNEHWSAALKIKEGEELCKYYSESSNKAEYNYPTMKKEILAVIRGIEKFLTFLAHNLFLFEPIAKGYLVCEKEFIKYASAKATSALAIMA